MTMKIIKLVNKPSYGHERLYPACEISKAFANKLKRTCWRRKDVELFESLDITVEIEQPPVKQTKEPEI